MLPAGYMAKKISQRPDWVKQAAVHDIYSVSGCVSENFADYINFWKHNGYWLFDSPDVIRALATEYKIDLSGTTFFYYEVFDHQYNAETKAWETFKPEQSFTTNIFLPENKILEGFDVVTFVVQNSPECSPLSCNGLAETTATNSHCLLTSFDDAQQLVEASENYKCEPGPYRIFAVYSLPKN